MWSIYNLFKFTFQKLYIFLTINEHKKLFIDDFFNKCMFAISVERYNLLQNKQT